MIITVERSTSAWGKPWYAFAEELGGIDFSCENGEDWSNCGSPIGEGSTIPEAIEDFLEKIDDGDVSDCCGAAPRGNGDNDTKDYGICPDCGDHCEYINPTESYSWN